MSDRRLALVLTIVYFFLVALVFSIQEVAAIIVVTFINVAILGALSNYLYKYIKSRVVSNTVALVVFFLMLLLALYLIIPAVLKEFGSFYSVIMENVKTHAWRSYIKNEQLLNFVEKLFEYLKPTAEDYVKGEIARITASIPSFALQLFFIILGTIYSLIYIDQLKKFPEMLYPKRVWRISDPFVEDLFANLRRFVQAVFVTALITGMLFFLIFEIMGLKYSVTIGVWAFLTNFIPIVGVIFEYVPVFLFSLSLGLKGVILMAVFTLIIHTIAFVTFLSMMKGYTKINPVVMLFFIMIMWRFQGLLGIFIAVPITIFISVFWKHFLRPFFEGGVTG